MIRRKFLGFIIAILAIGVAGMFFFNSSFIRKIYYKIQNRLNPASGPKPDSQREESTLPKDGVLTSVETALNSRCTSDYDDNPRNFHWGMFDKNKILATTQIEQIINYAKIPRFTSGAIEIKAERNILTFLIDNRLTAIHRDWTMVESGMQHQAMGLVCAALSAGYAFNSQGADGQPVSDDKFATVQIKLDAMKPSYDGACWSNAAPAETKPWKRGTLPDPIRQGNKSLISTLAELKTKNNTGRHISQNDLGQLLWAARGRTPHYHMSAPWGMTIPTYHGEEGISDVFVIADGNLSKYINWKNKWPTHSLEITGKINNDAAKLLVDQYKSGKCFIVLGRNRNEAKARWEIGYQLLNLMLQAHALNLSYSALLLDENQKKPFRNSGIEEPVAALLLQNN
jgi:hypothetical protein